MNKFEKNAIKNGFDIIAGTDEVGRGCIAGPIVCAAVILPIGYKNSEIRDSKLLSKAKREILAKEIFNSCLDYSIIEIDSKIIDKINPKKASILGMTKCIEKLKIEPNFILVDFEKLEVDIPQMSIVKGDQKSISIAAASIIAKVYRDNLMENMSKDFPNYFLHKNKGYLTKDHREAIEKYGPINGVHRFSYKPIRKN